MPLAMLELQGYLEKTRRWFDVFNALNLIHAPKI